MMRSCGFIFILNFIKIVGEAPTKSGVDLVVLGEKVVGIINIWILWNMWKLGENGGS